MPRGVREDKMKKDTVVHHSEYDSSEDFDELEENADDVGSDTRSRRRPFVSARKKRNRKILLIVSCVFLVLLTTVIILLSPITAFRIFSTPARFRQPQCALS